MSRHGSSSAGDRGSEPASPDQILLLMRPTGDRSVLKEWLGRQHDVSVGTEAEALDRAFDCCLVDDAMFARHHDGLAECKRRAQPTFLPFLLVLTGREPSTDEPRLWEHVDELLRTPIRKTELQSRLVGLLSRRQLSKALVEQQERYRRILQTIPDPVFVLDETGLVSECNPAFEQHMSRDGAQVMGSLLEAISAFPDDTVAALSALAEGARSRAAIDPAGDEDAVGSRPEPTSVAYRRADGTERTAEVAVAPLRTAPDGTEETLFVFRDVTERQDRERALRRERERLGEFASMLAHEVRNPLNVAQGYLEQVNPDTQAEQEALERVVAAQSRMEQMIKELLAHARGGTVDEVQPVALRVMVETAWRATRTGGATLALELQDETIEADTENLQTVLENLFRNAVLHAGPEVTVRVGALEPGGFYVEDDGPGIAPADREAVFERGFTTSAGGSGLGLTLVRQIVDAHGWEIQVVDGAAGGARFEITGIEGAT